MIDLTLNSFLRPDLVGLKPPFGTIIERTAENKGGLSTAQTDNNMAMPFALMRPVTVATSDTTSRVEYDAKLLLTGSSEVTITLDKAVYEGCRLTVSNRASENAIITAEKIEGVTGGRINLGINCILELNYTELDGWIYSNAIVGEIRTLTGTNAPVGWLICDDTEYDVLQYPRLAPIMLKFPFNAGVTDGRFRVPDMRGTDTFHGEMSDYEEFTFSATNTPVPYNGFISFSLSVRGGAIREIYVNDVLVAGCNNNFSTEYLAYSSCMVAVKKGDMIRGNPKNMTARARWFKKPSVDTIYIIKY